MIILKPRNENDIQTLKEFLECVGLLIGIVTIFSFIAIIQDYINFP